MYPEREGNVMPQRSVAAAGLPGATATARFARRKAAAPLTYAALPVSIGCALGELGELHILLLLAFSCSMEYNAF